MVHKTNFNFGQKFQSEKGFFQYAPEGWVRNEVHSRSNQKLSWQAVVYGFGNIPPAAPANRDCGLSGRKTSDKPFRLPAEGRMSNFSTRQKENNDSIKAWLGEDSRRRSEKRKATNPICVSHWKRK